MKTKRYTLIITNEATLLRIPLKKKDYKRVLENFYGAVLDNGIEDYFGLYIPDDMLSEPDVVDGTEDKGTYLRAKCGYQYKDTKYTLIKDECKPGYYWKKDYNNPVKIKDGED